MLVGVLTQIFTIRKIFDNDAQKANKKKLVEAWQTIKKDRKRHMHMLKEALKRFTGNRSIE
jgi:hypothetical protein